MSAGLAERSHWPKVLLVEDDESHILALTVGLEREGLSVTSVRTSSDAIPIAERLRPDVVLLDLMLPDGSGIDVCRELRGRGFDVPIIIVSSKSEELDVVVGIEVGADDYVAKPYRIRELVARIGAVLRRRRGEQSEGEELIISDGGGVMRVGDIVLDAERHEVVIRGEEVDLPFREFQVLRELLQNAGRVLTRETLLERIWGLDYDGDPRIVATLVGRLRARIEETPEAPTHILTIRGVGYRFNDRV